MMPIMAKSGNACYYCSIWSAFCFAWLALLPMCECVVEKTDFITYITYFPLCILYTSLLTPTFPNQLFSLSSLKRCTLVHLSNRSSCTYSLCYPTGNRVSHCSMEIILIPFMSDSTKVAAEYFTTSPNTPSTMQLHASLSKMPIPLPTPW